MVIKTFGKVAGLAALLMSIAPEANARTWDSNDHKGKDMVYCDEVDSGWCYKRDRCNYKDDLPVGGVGRYRVDCPPRYTRHKIMPDFGRDHYENHKINLK